VAKAATKKETLRKMDGSGEAEIAVNTDLSTDTGRADALCPTCGKVVEGHKCRLCGNVKTINQVSGQLIWMRGGRLVRAFHDEKQAYVRIARENGIPEEKWPKEFRGD
jgi:predicted RNA-binding Zn-ribbon protein involved in translation (DUF1610 family)